MDSYAAAMALRKLDVKVSQDRVYCLVPYISSTDQGFTLDGEFTLEDLEALIAWHKDPTIAHLVNAPRGAVIFEG